VVGPDSDRIARENPAAPKEDGPPRFGPNPKSGLLLQNRNFLRLFAAGIASVGGSAIAQVCLIWIIATDTGSSLDVAYYAIAAVTAGIAFSLVGGAFVDRYDRRRLMIVADLSRAATVGGLFVSLDLFGFRLGAVLVAAFVVSAFSTVFNPAEQAITPILVEPARVATANGLIQSTRNVASFVGAAVAGVLIVSVGALAGVGYNALTFLVSGILIAQIALPRTVFPLPPGGTRGFAGVGSFVRQMREGFAWLRQSVGLLQLTISAGFFNFFSTIYGTFIVFYATVALHGSAVQFAVLVGLELAGSAAGALLVGRTNGVRFAGKAWLLGFGSLQGAMLAMLALVPNVGVAYVLVFTMGLAGAYAGTAWLSYAQLAVPTEMQGRYFGIDSLGSWVMIPVGQLAGGLLIASVGISETYLIAGVGWLIAGIVFLAPRSLWRLGYRATARTAVSDSGTSGSPAENQPS
jgi:Transmembrane secretion effector